MDNKNEKSPTYKGRAAIKSAPDRIKGDKKLPADSEMEKAVERAKAADGIEELGARQAEQQSDRR